MMDGDQNDNHHESGVSETPKSCCSLTTMKQKPKQVLTIILGSTLLALFIFLSIPLNHGQYEDPNGDIGCSHSTEPYTRIIHQIWLNYSAFPEEWEAPLKHCQDMNKDHKYMLWSASAIETLLAEEFPWILSTYHGYSHNVQRVDAARLFILYKYGGVYIDSDIGCVQPFSNITKNMNRFDVILSRGSTFGVSNHIMLAKPRHPYLKQAIDSLPEHNHFLISPYITIMYTAGPGFLTVMLKKFPCKDQVFVFPAEPEHNQYYINFHGGSWHTWDTPIIDTLGAVHRGIKHVVSWRIYIIIFCIFTGLIAALYRYRQFRSRRIFMQHSGRSRKTMLA